MIKELKRAAEIRLKSNTLMMDEQIEFSDCDGSVLLIASTQTIGVLAMVASITLVISALQLLSVLVFVVCGLMVAIATGALSAVRGEQISMLLILGHIIFWPGFMAVSVICIMLVIPFIGMGCLTMRCGYALGKRLVRDQSAEIPVAVIHRDGLTGRSVESS